jgi:hypothetical protein
MEMVHTFTVRPRASRFPTLVVGLPPGLLLALLGLGLTFVLGDAFSTFFASRFSSGQEANPLFAVVLNGGLPALLAAKLVILAIIYSLMRLLVSTSGKLAIFWISLLLWVSAVFFAVVSVSNILTVLVGYDLYHLFVH